MKIRVLREAGGLGDVVRIIPAIRGLREAHPNALIHVFMPRHYDPLVKRAGWQDKIFHTPMNGSRRPRLSAADPKKWKYLDNGVNYDMSVDLFCPAFKHEVTHGHQVWNDRIELFCRAAAVTPSVMCPEIPLLKEEIDAAYQTLKERGIAEKKGWIALQPFSTDPARDWPPDYWWELAELLALEGYGVFAIDCVKGRISKMPCPQLRADSLLSLGAILKICRLLISPDSGPAHLCAAVGGYGLGITASQPGAVLYRHYPNHTYIHPDDYHCDWPCFWSRPEQCRRFRLKAAGDTCAALKRITVAEVADAAGRIMRNSNGANRRLPCLPPAGPSCAPRVVADILADSDATVIVGRDAASIPVHAPDRTKEHAALFTRPGAENSDQWLWELFRVLKVGGKLYAPDALNNAAIKNGFTPVAKHSDFSVWEKRATWPRIKEEVHHER